MKVIVEARVVSESGVVRQQIEYDRETMLITNVGKNIGKPDLNLKDSELLFPSFIDIHTHCREDSSKRNIQKEDFLTASKAALNGGVCVIADMPNNPIPPKCVRSYMRKKKLSAKALTPIVLYGAIGKGSTPFSFKAPYKYFMGPTTGVSSDNSLEANLVNYRGESVSFHCEDPFFFVEGESHSQNHPVISEVAAIKRAIVFIDQYQLKGIICHISTSDGLRLCLEAKERGINLRIEVTPHHLLFNSEFVGKDPHYQVNPPIRSKTEQIFLQDCLKKGLIDYIATDHAPHLPSEKQNGISGIPGLDTYGLTVGLLISRYGVSPEVIYKCCCKNPGIWVNDYLTSNVGQIKKGYMAAFTILDFENETKVTKEGLMTKCNWSPFEEIVFPLSIKTIGRFENERLDLN